MKENKTSNLTLEQISKKSYLDGLYSLQFTRLFYFVL